ncbi:hypothetical protein C0Q70_10556 [Pomacea canaliculata]|uniref:DUF7064 domain-containing protein n=1 Tax=Pomacea canaliculata TaxID=400727 RepID=A0A2T7P3J5_POMCA|nr:hypothetical protein C0Q70_10556 [Pomacea canaliculata]
MKQTTGQGAGYGMRSRTSPEDMDKVQILPPDHPKFADLGILEMPNMPDTNLQGEENKFAAGGLLLEPVEAMKTWRLSYQGKMRIKKDKKEVNVKFILNWNNFTPFFDFDTDMHPAMMADGIAREKWSREYFSTLQRQHQTHYEQFGILTGNIEIEGYETRRVELRGVRDHSYGNIRDWKSLHRYGLQYISLEDGSAICVGAISMPVALSRLTVGYVFHPDGHMDAVSSSEFELYDHGEDGRPPKSLRFKFSAGGKQYDMECIVLDCPIFYMGEEWDAKIYERFCQYQVNGLKGWGISEWDYRNYVGKEAEQEWYAKHEA